MSGSATGAQQPTDKLVHHLGPNEEKVEYRKWIQALAVTTDLTAIASLIHDYGIVDRIKIDGAPLELTGLFTLMNTQYAEDYSHAGFRQIRIGHTEKDVLELLGEPLNRIGPYGVHPCGTTECPPEGNYMCFVYSMPPNLRRTNYRGRVVILEGEVVVEVEARFNAD
ncbi:MAG: hypothetical protein JNN32_03095 [Flavobacteriales bacterium]|nr:hypothetical protein [Flavobacteriales bacterium]